MPFLMRIAQFDKDIWPSGYSELSFEVFDMALEHWLYLKKDGRSKDYQLYRSDGTTLTLIQDSKS